MVTWGKPDIFSKCATKSAIIGILSQSEPDFAQKRPRPLNITLGATDLAATGRPVPFTEPGAVVRHPGALGLRRTAPAGRGLLAVLGRAPPQLHAVIRIVGHLEIDRAI